MTPAVFFDFDGTLADTAPDMTAALNRWLREKGRAGVALLDARAHVSAGAAGLLNFAGVRDEELAPAREEFLSFYEQTGYRQTTLFAGVAEMTAKLAAAKIQWGVVTNKPRRYFAPLAEKLQLTQLGAAVLLAGDDGARAKPHPDLLLAAAAACRLPPPACSYVGDDLRDAMAAAAAGMDFYVAAWGYWRRQEWDKAAVAGTASHPRLVPNLILGNHPRDHAKILP